MICFYFVDILSVVFCSFTFLRFSNVQIFTFLRYNASDFYTFLRFCLKTFLLDIILEECN